MKPVLRKKPIWIPVVTALIQKDGKILVGRRPPGHSLSGLWEFPGGKMELGELPEESLRRELREELGIEAEIGNLRLVNSHSYGERAVLILFFDVHYWKGEPKALHHDEIRWIEPDEMNQLPIPDANRKVLARILAMIKKSADPAET